MKIILANSRGISNKQARRQFFRRLTEEQADILMLSETKLLTEDLTAVRMAWGQYQDQIATYIDCNDNAPGRSGGVAILFRLGLNFTVNQSVHSRVGSHIILDVTVQAYRYKLAVFYGDPSTSDPNSRNRLRTLREDLDRLHIPEPHSIIIGGDFNFVTNIKDSTRAPFKAQTRQEMNDIIEQNDLIDLWDFTNPDEEGYTITTNTGINTTRSRLDRLYVQEEALHNPTMAIKTTPKPGADHKMIIAELRTTIADKPLFKHPDYLLDDINYRKNLDNNIRELLLIHSQEAEEYYSASHVQIAGNEQEEPQHDAYREVPLPNVSDLEEQYMDRSERYIQAKIHNMLVRRYGGEPDNTRSLTEMLDRIMDNTDYTQHCKPSTLWEAIISKIQSTAIIFRKRRKKDLATKLTQNIDKLSKMRDEGKEPSNDPEAAEISQQIEVLANKMYLNSTNSSAVTAGKEGDRPTKSYLSTGKRTTGKTKIHHIKAGNRDLMGNDATEHMMEKFKKLLGTPAKTDDNMSIEEFLQGTGVVMDMVPPHLEELLTADISQGELDEVVKQSHTDSSPGYNGFSYKLLKAIWPMTRKLFLQMTKEITDTATSKGTLPLFMRVRKLILLLKPGKECTDDNSYRPISLLDISYKVMAAALANRLKIAASYLIGAHQKGYMKGRNAAEVTRAVQDIRDHALGSSSPLAIVGLDFSKAFDSVAHSAVEKIMRYLGFPEKFIEIVMLMLREAQIILDINGKRSEAFLLEDGTGQGDPLSSFLFNVVIEPFIRRLSKDQRIKLYTVGQHTVTPEVFADDIHLFIDGNHPESLDGILHVAKLFSNLTGLNLSAPKTEVLEMEMNGPISRRAHQLGLLVVDKIKFVGAYITRKGDTSEQELNYHSPLKKMDRVIKSWIWRYPTPTGAAVITKSLITSTMTHLLINVDLPEQTFKAYQKKVRELIWQNRAQVQRRRMHQPVGNGGMNIPDLKKFVIGLRIKWYRQMLPEQQPTTCPSWKFILNQWLDRYQLNADDIPYMGHEDIRILAGKMEEDGHSFWATTLHGISRVAKIWEENTRQIAQLPIFGGRLKLSCRTTKWMSIFNTTTPCLNLFKHGIKMAGEVFADHTATRFDSTRTKEYAETNLPYTVKGVFTNVKHAVVRIQTRLLIEGTIIQPNYPMKKHRTLLHEECLQKSKGGKFVYKALLQDERNTHKIEIPPAFFTWKNSINHTMRSKDWRNSLELINKHKFSPRARWLSLQIFLRTYWTPQKQFQSYGEDDMGFCELCREWPADTRHIFFECHVAQKIWKCVNDIISEVYGNRTSFTEHHILFHMGLKENDILKSGTIMAAKSAINIMHHRQIMLPIHDRVIAAFLRTQLLLLTDTYLRNAPEDGKWMTLRTLVHKHLEAKKNKTTRR